MAEGKGITGNDRGGADEEITLGRGNGAETYKIVPQGIGRIERKIRAIMAVFMDADSSEDAAQLDPAIVRDALVAFIPDLMPEFKLRGLRDAEALEQLKEQGAETLTDDQVTDTDPSVPQLMDAIEAIYRVNGGDRLVRFLGKFVDPEMLRARIRYELRTRGVQPADQPSSSTASSGGSPRPPQSNGGSAQPTSSTPVPAPDPTVLTD